METQRSDYILRRKSVMQHLAVPKMSRVKQLLGNDLAEVVFAESDKPLRETMGLEPPLQGAGDELWNSPSDLLVGKVCLKPPLTSKHIRALTHKGILSIGRDIEQRFWNEMELEKERALKTQAESLRATFDVELRNIGAEVQRREEQKCAKEMRKLEKEFEQRLMEELRALEERMSDDTHLVEMLAKQKAELDDAWLKRLEKEVEETVRRMTQDFVEETQRQERLLMQKFEVEMMEAETKRLRCIEEERQHCKESIRHLRHQLECKNIANMMYILCMERQKCRKEKFLLNSLYEAQAGEQRRAMEAKEEEIIKLEEDNVDKQKELDLREECLKKILEQFQKFINFALKACPTQAEFLLNVEKLMMFDLTDTLEKKGETLQEFMPCEDGVELPKPPEVLELEQQTTTVSKQSSFHSKKSYLEGGLEDLYAHDYHQCFNEFDLPPELRPATDGLPMFYYNNRMYIREDFRNIFSHGVKLSPSHHLWNEDVESLMNILKHAIEMDNTTCGSKHSSITKRLGEPCVTTDRSEKGMGGSSVYFTDDSLGLSTDLPSNTVPSPDRQSSVVTATTVPQRPLMKIPAEEHENIDFKSIGKEERRKTLLSTINSLELIRMSQIKAATLADKDDKVEEEQETYEEEMQEGTVIDYDSDGPEGPDKMLAVHVAKEASIQDETSARLSVDSPKDISILSDIPQQQTKPAGEATKDDKRESSIKEDKASVKESKAATDDKSESIHGETIKLQRMETRRSSKLITATDSIILVKQATVQKLMDLEADAKYPKIKESSRSLRESMRGGSVTKGCLKPDKPAVEVQRTLSRLSEAKDSIELAKESLCTLRARMEKEKQVKKTPSTDAATLPDVVVKTSDPTQPAVYYPPREVTCDFEKTGLPSMYRTIATTEVPAPPVAAAPKLKIVGDVHARAHLQTTGEFTNERIHSFIKLIKDHPDLISMFTSFSR